MALVGPFPASAVIARLVSHATLLRVVDGAGGLQAALETPARTAPAAYVLTEETGGQPGDYSSALAQPMKVLVKVVLMVRNAQPGAGGAAAAAMETVERSVREALRKWSPAAPFEPLWVLASGHDDFHAGRLIRQVIFETRYRDQEAP